MISGVPFPALRSCWTGRPSSRSARITSDFAVCRAQSCARAARSTSPHYWRCRPNAGSRSCRARLRRTCADRSFLVGTFPVWVKTAIGPRATVSERSPVYQAIRGTLGPGLWDARYGTPRARSVRPELSQYDARAVLLGCLGDCRSVSGRRRPRSQMLRPYKAVAFADENFLRSASDEKCSRKALISCCVGCWNG